MRPLPEDAVVLAFGDSLTAGYGAEPGSAYPAVLEGEIGRRVINAGVNGETTNRALERLPAVLDQTRPALTLVCLGGNDMLRRIPDSVISANLKAMIELIREAGSRAVLIAVPRPGLMVRPATLYEEVAEESGVYLIEKLMSEVLSDPALKYDYIHPNAAGYRRIAAGIAEHLREAGALKREEP